MICSVRAEKSGRDAREEEEEMEDEMLEGVEAEEG